MFTNPVSPKGGGMYSDRLKYNVFLKKSGAKMSVSLLLCLLLATWSLLSAACYLLPATYSSVCYPLSTACCCRLAILAGIVNVKFRSLLLFIVLDVLKFSGSLRCIVSVRNQNYFETFSHWSRRAKFSSITPTTKYSDNNWLHHRTTLAINYI